jgi:hypothetical protein
MLATTWLAPYISLVIRARPISKERFSESLFCYSLEPGARDRRAYVVSAILPYDVQARAKKEFVGAAMGPSVSGQLAEPL